jgi:ATP-dependent helicase/DNAse subunit B
LTALVQCPYRFALQTLFKIKVLGEPALWPSHIERGNLLHMALQAVQADLRTISTGDAADNAANTATNNATNTVHLMRAIREALRSLLTDNLPLSGRYAALVADCERTLETYASAHEARLQEGWRLESTETPIESRDLLPNVRVHGKMDRVDVLRSTAAADAFTTYAVLDYKTSNRGSLKSRQKNPLLDAQLVLYTALMALNDRDVAQAAYWRLHDGLHQSSTPPSKTYHASNTVMAVEDLPQHTDTMADTVQVAWQSLVDNHIAAVSPSLKSCEYCEYKGVCRSAIV